jgi:hypothetical protein
MRKAIYWNNYLHFVHVKKELAGIQLQIKNLHADNCYFETAPAVQLVSPVDGRRAASSTE